MKEIYKVRHIPTGLYVQPSNAGNHNSNLGKRGKLYEGDNIWARIQHKKEYRFLEVHEGYSVYKELVKKFPDRVVKSTVFHNNCIEFIAEPSDFEKEVIIKI